MILVGSQALKYWGVNPREPKDTDLWSVGSERPSVKGDQEIHYVPQYIYDQVPIYDSVATLDALYTIKCSHAHWNVHWDKTMRDIVYLKGKKCSLIPDLYKALYKYWTTVHGNKEFLSLNKSKKDFFTDYVTYQVDHDRLHELVSINDRPLYERFLKDGQDVLIDKHKFFAAPKEDQLNLFLEEIRVIMIERFMIPNNWNELKVKAYKQALKKTITNLTKGWASLFLVENYHWYNKQTNFSWLREIKPSIMMMEGSNK